METSPIRWRRGPLTLPLASVARLRLGQGMIAAEGGEMRRFLQQTGNELSWKDLAVVGPDDLRWFAVVSLESTRGAPRSGQREEWSDDSVEPDGRQVRIRTVAVPAGQAVLTFEVVSERKDADLAKLESDDLMDRLELPQTGRSPQWLLPALAVVAFVAYCVYWMILRRQRAATESRQNPDSNPTERQ